MDSRSRGVLTMAYGSPRHVEMAKSLARSLRVHSPQVPRAIVTDSDDPELNRLFDVRTPLNRDFGKGLRQKLHLDEYTPFDRTLFVDSDCLVVRDIDEIWGCVQGLHFGIPGTVTLRRGDKDPDMDVDYILDYFNLFEVPKFNSGLIYFDISEESRSIFSTARELLPRHEELRVVGSGTLSDEPLLSVSMALHRISLFSDEGRTMRTPAGLRGNIEIDVIRGVGVFNKYGMVLRPTIVHFAGPFSKSFEYRRECYKLQHQASDYLRQRTAVLRLWLVANHASTIQKRINFRSRAALVKQWLIRTSRSWVPTGSNLLPRGRI